MRGGKIGWVGALCCALLASSARAGSISATLRVSATVVSTCRVKTTPLAFGNYDSTGTNAAAPLDGVGAVTIFCSAGTRATIAILAARVPAEVAGARAMRGKSDYLAYELYKDPGRQQAWADGAGALNVPPAFSAQPREYPIYGRIPAGQEVEPGAYDDLAVVVVGF